TPTSSPRSPCPSTSAERVRLAKCSCSDPAGGQSRPPFFALAGISHGHESGSGPPLGAEKAPVRQVMYTPVGPRYTVTVAASQRHACAKAQLLVRQGNEIVAGFAESRCGGT